MDDQKTRDMLRAAMENASYADMFREVCAEYAVRIDSLCTPFDRPEPVRPKGLLLKKLTGRISKEEYDRAMKAYNDECNDYMAEKKAGKQVYDDEYAERMALTFCHNLLMGEAKKSEAFVQELYRRLGITEEEGTPGKLACRLDGAADEASSPTLAAWNENRRELLEKIELYKEHTIGFLLEGRKFESVNYLIQDYGKKGELMKLTKELDAERSEAARALGIKL